MRFSLPLVLQRLLPGLMVIGVLGAAAARPKEPILPTRWMLVYAGGPQRPKYTVDDYVHVITAVDSADHSVKWLGTGVLYLEVWATSGRAFATFADHPWANGSDWSTYLDTLFSHGSHLSRLDSAVALAERTVGSLGHPFPVAVMIPYPDTALDTLRFGGRVFHLLDVTERLALVHAWTDSVKARFSAGGFSHLTLYGMYWLQEKAAGGDRPFLPKAAAVVHQAKLRFLWIPYYWSNGHELWRKFGFDEAWYQPNYFFRLGVPALRLDSAMRQADSLGMGIELEFDPRLFTNTVYANRFSPYLMALWLHPELRRRSVAVYDGGGALLTLSRSRDARMRGIYQEFVDAVASSSGL